MFRMRHLANELEVTDVSLAERSPRHLREPVRAAVVGCGAVARTHLPAIHRVRGIAVIAVCDKDERRATATAREFGVPRIYEDPAELFAQEHPDVVHVLTPPDTHHEVTMEALRQGSHVLVEKPMALSSSEADDMIEAARRQDRSLAVCHNFLFEPAAVRARRLAESGRLGQILSVDAYWSAYRHGQPDRYSHTGWIPELPGGALHEIAPHAVYTLQAFLGPVEMVHAAVRSPSDLSPPCGEAHVLFNGRLALGSASLSLSTRPQTITVRVHGTDATVQADLIRHVVTTQGTRLPPWREPCLSAYPGHDALIARFYESLRESAPPPVTGEQGRDVVGVLERLWSAIEPVGPPP